VGGKEIDTYKYQIYIYGTWLPVLLKKEKIYKA